MLQSSGNSIQSVTETADFFLCAEISRSLQWQIKRENVVSITFKRYINTTKALNRGTYKN